MLNSGSVWHCSASDDGHEADAGIREEVGKPTDGHSGGYLEVVVLFRPAQFPALPVSVWSLSS
jgi:hypothetical protein